MLPPAFLPPIFCNNNCGLGSGEDACSRGLRGSGNHPFHPGKCTPLVVRPHEIPKPPLPLPVLPPVGSPCSCHTALVKPAVVPKPVCTAGPAYAGRIDLSQNHQLTLNQQQQILFGGGCNQAHQQPIVFNNPGTRPILIEDIINRPSNPANGVPADPVSLSIAYKLAQENCNHDHEDKLAFGFRTMPKEIPVLRFNKVIFFEINTVVSTPNFRYEATIILRKRTYLA